jgi:KDO2-lipid IV(A) lauroyltransferase
MRRTTILIVDAVFWLSGKLGYLIFYISGWRFLSFVGRFIGSIIYCYNKRTRDTIKDELKLLFGKRFDKEEIEYITKMSFKNYYERQIETIFFGAMNKHRINSIMTVEGIENLDSALSKGKGVILLLSHFGSFLLPLPFLGHMGYNVNQIVGKQINSSFIAERLWVWRKKEADRLPVNFIQVDRFLRPLYKALKDNEIIAIAFDGRDSTKWVTTKFFERKALFSPGPFELARKTGATIIPTFVVRTITGTHRLILEPGLKLSTQRDKESALYLDTERFTEIFCNYIAKYPCHFAMVLYKVRKGQLDGVNNPFYAEV